MFITSFIPLWISIILILIIDHIASLSIFFEYYFNEHIINFELLTSNTIWAIQLIFGILFFNIASIFIILFGISFIKKHTNFQYFYEIKEVSKEQTITSEYLLSYILPLFAFDFSTIKGLLCFMVYFIILGFLCIKNNNVYANLFFELQKYSFYNCQVDTGKQILIISKKDLCSKIGHKITVGELNQSIYIEVN